MLNSHIDTVHLYPRQLEPSTPPLSDTHIYGLGSNDAGASVVSMIMTFLHFYGELLITSCWHSRQRRKTRPAGMSHLWQQLKQEVDMAIIGEPTGMRAAIAERGLLVIDGEAKGVSGHAAREEE